ncbi:MAG: PEP-CTERM sorting domain-containing protein, partial [Massilia sp.]
IYLASGIGSIPDSSAVTGAPTSNPARDNGSNAGGNGNGNAFGLDKGNAGNAGNNGGNADAGTPLTSLVPQIAAAAAPLVVPVEIVKQLLADDAAVSTSPVIAALAPVLLADEGTVPEPATLTLMLAGLLGLGTMARRRRL